MSYIYFIGIDVSKEFFDVGRHDRPGHTHQFTNNSVGFAEFNKAYADILPKAFVVMEATGGYETALLASLLQQGLSVHRADPRASSFFIRSLGKRAKTDRLDALALARYGQERHTELLLAKIKGEDQECLQLLLTRRADLVAMRVAERNRLKHPTYARADMRSSIKAVLSTLDSQIDALDLTIQTLVQESKSLATKLSLMTDVPGIGKQTAYTLLALMPELGTLTRRKAASLAGCAPHPRDSGKSMGYRAATGGRQYVKRALFMAAMAARNWHPQLKAFYESLIHNGKKRMVALVAVMRKLIVILNAKIRDLNKMQNLQTTW